MSSVTFDILARDRASAALSKVGKSIDQTGKKLDRAAQKTARAGAAMTAGLTVPLVAFGAKSFQVFAGFDKTMRQVGVQTKQAGKGMKELTDLAMKLGAETSFSAKDAADAMLELAKGGLTAAQIKGGALAQTLTLAAAGSLELGDAAGYMANTLNTFGLQAKDAARVSAALAGGANASTASVESLGMALSQVGPGARNAGLSLNDTVAVLAAFDSAGIKGSDAGTSLKTMLTRLVPTTDKAKAAMQKLGLEFVNADGSFKNVAAIAQELQTGMKGLSEAERTAAMATIFGSDATRAATVLMNEGKKGVDKYRKATEDLGAAQKMAKTNTQGAAGSIEQMQGSIETAQISIGKALAPAVTKAAKKVTELANAFANLSPETQETILKVAGAVAVLGPLMLALGGVIKTIAVLRVAVLALGLSMNAIPFVLIITGLVALGVALVAAYKKSESFRRFVDAAFAAVAAAVLNLGRAVLFMAKVGLHGLKILLSGMLGFASSFLGAAEIAFGWMPEVGPKIKGANKAFKGFEKTVMRSMDSAIGKVDAWDANLQKMQKEVRLKADISNLESKLRQAKKGLKDPNLTKERRAKLNADISALQHKLSVARNELGNLKGRTVDVHVRVTQNITRKVEEQLSRHVPAFATGTRNAPKGLAWVGEEGPELVQLSGGERIYPAGESARMGSKLSGSEPQTVRVVFDVRGGDADLRRLIRHWIRTDNLLQGARA